MCFEFGSQLNESSIRFRRFLRPRRDMVDTPGPGTVCLPLRFVCAHVVFLGPFSRRPLVLGMLRPCSVHFQYGHARGDPLVVGGITNPSFFEMRSVTQAYACIIICTAVLTLYMHLAQRHRSRPESTWPCCARGLAPRASPQGGLLRLAVPEALGPRVAPGRPQDGVPRRDERHHLLRRQRRAQALDASRSYREALKECLEAMYSQERAGEVGDDGVCVVQADLPHGVSEEDYERTREFVERAQETLHICELFLLGDTDVISPQLLHFVHS